MRFNILAASIRCFCDYRLLSKRGRIGPSKILGNHGGQSQQTRLDLGCGSAADSQGRRNLDCWGASRRKTFRCTRGWKADCGSSLVSVSGLQIKAATLVDIMPPTRAPQLREDHLETLEVLRVDGDHSFRQAPIGIWALILIFTKHSLRVVGKEPQPPEWQRIGNQIDAAFIFARSDFVNVGGMHSGLSYRVADGWPVFRILTKLYKIWRIALIKSPWAQCAGKIDQAARVRLRQMFR